SGSFPSNTIANPKGELKSITTRSGIVLDGPSVPIPPIFINPEEDEPVEETLTDQDLAEDPLYQNILYPSWMLKKKQQEKDEVQIHKFWQMFKQLHINITLADALILIPKYQKLLKALLSNKEKLQELTNTPLNENCSTPSGNLTFPSHPEITSSEVKDDIFDQEEGNVLLEKLLDLDSTKDPHPPLHVNPLSGSTTSSSSSSSHLLEDNLADLNNNLVDSMPEMFTDEHALDYSSPSLFDEYDDDLFEVESNTKNIYDDPFDSKEDKIKESKLLIDELDLPCDFLLPFEYDSILSKDFPRLMLCPQPKTRTRSKMLLLFSSENEEKLFKPGIHTSKKVYSSLITELSHQGYKVFKINLILKSPIKNFLFSCGKNTHIWDVPCLQFCPLDQFKYEGFGSR
nr:hypothetical protein [Tanacetum cinerariifolium]